MIIPDGIFNGMSVEDIKYSPYGEFYLLNCCGKNKNEVIVYESAVVEKSFDRIFAAVLFYSPRGVYAFAKANKQQPQQAICIGETTAAAAREVFPNVIVANKQTVENVLVTAIKLLRDDKK